MCKCTPGIKTPFCGKPGCEWPPQIPVSSKQKLIDLLEERSRKHDAFRLAETAVFDGRADGYHSEMNAFDIAHGKVLDWFNETDHLDELLGFLRAHETPAEVPHMMASLDRIAREDASTETPARRDTGVLDTNGERLLEGDRVRVEWTAELGVTELHCEAVGTVVYMPDKITAAWFVQFDTPFRRSVGPEGLYTSESQMLLQEREIGDECLIHFEKLGAQKTAADVPPSSNLRSAVEWVLRDMAYKAPEQIDHDMSMRWYERLKEALDSPDETPREPQTCAERDAARYEWVRENWPALVTTVVPRHGGVREVIDLQVSPAIRDLPFDPQSLDHAIDAKRFVERDRDAEKASSSALPDHKLGNNQKNYSP